MSQIFLVVGAPAVGKSTTAHALAARFEKSIHIPVDDLRDMVVSGLALPGEWNARLVEQLRLARESAVHTALAYREAGFVVAIDDFWDPNSRLEEYSALQQEPEVYKILLYPSQQVAQERNLKRSGPSEINAYIAGGIREVYAHLPADAAFLQRRGWVVVDTTDKSVEETVDEILSAG